MSIVYVLPGWVSTCLHVSPPHLKFATTSRPCDRYASFTFDPFRYCFYFINFFAAIFLMNLPRCVSTDKKFGVNLTLEVPEKACDWLKRNNSSTRRPFSPFPSTLTFTCAGDVSFYCRWHSREVSVKCSVLTALSTSLSSRNTSWCRRKAWPWKYCRYMSLVERSGFCWHYKGSRSWNCHKTAAVSLLDPNINR